MDKKKSFKNKQKGRGDNEEEEEEQEEEPQVLADKQEELWRHCRARKILLHKLKQKEIPLTANKEADDKFYSSHPAFMKFEELKWPGRLAACRKIISRKIELAKRDAKCIANFRQANPTQTHNAFGRINWKGSKADEKLRKAVEDGENKNYRKPSEFRETDFDYEEFTKDRFRDRIHQLERSRKFKNYVDNLKEQKLKALRLDETEE